MDIPKPTKPKSHGPKLIFETQNYQFANSKKIINLPVRPKPVPNDITTTKQNTRRYVSALKAAVLELERNNNRQIIIMRTNDNWWEFGANSLLFYQFHLQKSYGLTKLTTRIDKDFGKTKYPSNPGIAVIKKIELFTHNLLTKVKAKLVLETPDLLIFDLPNPYSKVDIDSFRNIREAKEARFNTLTTPTSVCPGTRAAATQLTKILLDKCSAVDPFRREACCQSGVKLMVWISTAFVSMANGRIGTVEYYTTAIKKIALLNDWLVFVKSINLLDLDSCTRLATDIADLKERLTADLKMFKELEAKKDSAVKIPQKKGEK